MRNIYHTTFFNILGFNLALLCFFLLGISYIEARREIDTISISSGTAEFTDTGQEVEFKAGYETTMNEPTDTYKLFVCQDKQLEKNNQNCKGLTYCDSGDLSLENPLSCYYDLTNQLTSSQFYMFVCNQSSECSSAFSASLTQDNGTLGISTPSEMKLEGVDFSFDGQLSKDNTLGNIIITSLTHNHPGWSVDATAQDWESDKYEIMDYDGDGFSSGQLTINMDKALINSSDFMQEILLGETASFSSSVNNINIARAEKKSGNGTFVIEGINLEQFIPGNQKEGEYKTVLIFTIS